jgi:hypothetical protein
MEERCMPGARTPTVSEEQPQELQEESTGEQAPAEEAQNVTDVSNVETSQEVTPEAPESEPQEVEAEEAPDAFTPQPIQNTAPPAPDIRSFVDPEGNLDLNSYQAAQQTYTQEVFNASVAAAAQTAQQLTKYQQDWQTAESKYPELKNNRQYRDMVQAIHANSANPASSTCRLPKQLTSCSGFATKPRWKALGLPRKLAQSNLPPT